MKNRIYHKFLIDLLLWVVAFPAAYFIRFEGQWLPYVYDIGLLMLISVPVIFLVNLLFRLHRQSWHNISIRDLISILKSVILVTAVLAAIAFISGEFLFIPVSVPVISGLIAILLLGGVRVLARLVHDYSSRLHSKKLSDEPVKRVLVVGAGSAGNLLLREIFRNSAKRMDPVGLLDDDCGKQNIRFMGVPCLGRIEDLVDVVKAGRVDLVIIAMPAAPGKVIRRVVELAKSAGVEYQIMPGLFEFISGKFNISQLRKVDVQDLLRRDHVKLDFNSISGYIKNRDVMVTGAGGSIGSEIVKQIINCDPRKVILLGRGENSIFDIQNECANTFRHIKFVSLITDVKDIESLEINFRKHRPHVVFHAAAHKHVTLMENNPEQAVFNNIGGTRNVVNMALKYGTGRFVNVSSDKSVNPTSVMGASKRVAEYVVQEASGRAAEGQQFVSVRFGNVLGSRGSVVPVFKRQIERGGPITITHPDMTRYFMTIPEASQLVIQAGALGGNGSVYVLDMGEPVKITSLAHDLIKLSGLTPGDDIEIVYTGMRPGEKMFEELLTDEESTSATMHSKIFIARASGLPENGFSVLLDELFNRALSGDEAAVKKQLKALVPTYVYECE